MAFYPLKIVYMLYKLAPPPQNPTIATGTAHDWLQVLRLQTLEFRLHTYFSTLFNLMPFFEHGCEIIVVRYWGSPCRELPNVLLM